MKNLPIEHNLAEIPKPKRQNRQKLWILVKSISALYTTLSTPACMVANPEKCRQEIAYFGLKSKR